MEKYEVLSIAGEGSFGRVYKAKRRDTQEVVAFKVIPKIGRSLKELDSFRQECEVQRHLNHPNIIQMLDSFETEHDIVVVSEFADKQLYAILGKEGYLPEDRVRKITCDLVSALFYLHSNRVLHRDLKPQNVLLDAANTAKLCDFGFARHMGKGTMLLTSIKGTPLYMAPELIKESPYDHNADLWSLGCIVYELLVGIPPFKSSSVLHLVRLIHNEQIRFPEYVSQECVAFLQGLLQKDPNDRLTWPDLLHHPFLKGNVVIQQDLAASLPPLTEPLSNSQQKVKETQRQILLDKHPRNAKLVSKLEEQLKQKLSLDEKDEEEEEEVRSATPTPEEPPPSASSKDRKGEGEEEDEVQNFEWQDYLQRSMEEVIGGDLSCLLRPPLVRVATAPLLRRTASARVLDSVACLLMLPLVCADLKPKVSTLLEALAESNVVDQLVQGLWSLLAEKNSDLHAFELVKSKRLGPERLQAVEHVVLLLSHLVHRQPYPKVEIFLCQWCNAVRSRGPSFALLTRHLLTLSKRRPKIVADTLAIFNHVLRALPSQAVLVLEALVGNSATKARGKKPIDPGKFLDNPNAMLRLNTLTLMQYLSAKFGTGLFEFWDANVKQKVAKIAKEEKDLKTKEVAVRTLEVIEKVESL
ncbi:serine/threonine-protein kinase 36 [Neocloeon triangulifer]|uniref:serine/threonine-protein kinase 36 n=1 Tax=Neocloeon triangulifer TaxID=2078957 RepID=UPI00286F67AA|nr:serine/threonine-protein kinase 36 [Neocloeon triangulifer]